MSAGMSPGKRPEPDPPPRSVTVAVTTGSSPEAHQVTVTLPTLAARIAFADWVTSGDAWQQFWQWMSVHGYHI